MSEVGSRMIDFCHVYYKYILGSKLFYLFIIVGNTSIIWSDDILPMKLVQYLQRK